MTKKRLLMIAYHFPPLAGSSGIQRTLRFVQHLPSFDWEPLVISADPRAYENTSDDLMPEIPEGTVVQRSFALDTARHLSIGGRYLGFMARPDRWISWRFAAIREGMKLIQKYKPDAIWSTYPIATAHIIGRELAHRTGLPWIADFRDPMAQDGYPPDPATWQAFKRIEEQAMRESALNIFTTPGAARVYANRYPHASARITVIENGYDETTFSRAESALGKKIPLTTGCLTLLHSGIVYPSERDPSALFKAFGEFSSIEGNRGRVRLRFRAAVHTDLLEQLASKHGVSDVVEILPSIPYEDALAEMLRADGLLVLQAAECNDQIPAKLYEYLRAGCPIIACTDPEGDTGKALAASGIRSIASLDDVAAIGNLLARFATSPIDGTKPRPEAIENASRAGRARTLVEQLNAILER